MCSVYNFEKLALKNVLGKLKTKYYIPPSQKEKKKKMKRKKIQKTEMKKKKTRFTLWLKTITRLVSGIQWGKVLSRDPWFRDSFCIN